MSAKDNLLTNIECEYKYAINKEYAATFMNDFCTKFNEVVALRYQALSEEFCSRHEPTEYLADPNKVVVEQLDNVYFDTEDDLLFKQFKAGIRLRRSSKQEGVEQTIKFKSNTLMAGASHTHVEHNVRSQSDLSTPNFDLFTDDQLPAGLKEFVLEHKISCKYQTNFKRQSIVVTVPRFVTFEVAVDQGKIIAGGLASVISEVEFELKDIDKDYLNEQWGKTIYDLDDVRFEFSALIDEILLLVSGAPTVFVDYSGITYDAPTDEFLINTNNKQTQDKDSSCTCSKSFESKYSEAPDLGNEGFEEVIDCTALFGVTQEQRIPSMPLKKGGLIGSEPLSKLRRAVILSNFYKDNKDKICKCDVDSIDWLHKSATLELNFDPKHSTCVDMDEFYAQIAEYEKEQNPGLALFNKTVKTMVDTMSLAIGLTNLFGTKKHMEDLRAIIEQCLRLSLDHKVFKITEEIKEVHRRLCQDQDLSDLSMLAVSECSSMFMEFNVKTWFIPFYEQLCKELENNPNFSGAEFKRLTRSAVDNSYSIKTNEYIERIGYILKRKYSLLNDDTKDNYKALALATQHHMKAAWSSVNLSTSH